MWQIIKGVFSLGRKYKDFLKTNILKLDFREKKIIRGLHSKVYIAHFLRNKKSENGTDLVKELIQS